MGHIVWNQIIDGKLTPSKASKLIMKQDAVYVVGKTGKQSKTPKVLKVDVQTSGETDYGRARSGAAFTLKANTYGFYEAKLPSLLFPMAFNEAYVEHEDEVLAASGSWITENDDDLSGFVADVYGGIKGIKGYRRDKYCKLYSESWMPEAKRYGWQSVWWTTDKKEADEMCAKIKEWINRKTDNDL